MTLKVMILAANAFIGSALTSAILRHRHSREVYGTDLSDHKLQGLTNSSRFRFVEGDITIDREMGRVPYRTQRAHSGAREVASSVPKMREPRSGAHARRLLREDREEELALENGALAARQSAVQLLLKWFLQDSRQFRAIKQHLKRSAQARRSCCVRSSVLDAVVLSAVEMRCGRAARGDRRSRAIRNRPVASLRARLRSELRSPALPREVRHGAGSRAR
jgi:hypothetical protein